MMMPRASACKGAFLVKVLVGVGIALVAIGLLCQCYFNHAILMYGVSKDGVLVNGSQLYNRWLHSHQMLKVYIFNVTNPVEVTKGGTPILKEVGPYVYNHVVHRIDLSLKESDDIEFRESSSSHFNTSLSGGLLETDIVTVMDFALLGTIFTAEAMAKDQMDRIKSLIDRMFPNRATPFVTASVGVLLFGGVPLNCSAKTALVHLICRQMTILAPSQFWMDENRVHRFAFLHAKNVTIQDFYSMNRGVKDPYKRGLLSSFRNKKQLSVWASPYCNMLNGSSDGSLFPFGINSESIFRYFEISACRSVQAGFVGTQDYQGLTVNRYEASEELFGSAEIYPENECFCPRGIPEEENGTAPLSCPPAGVFNLAMCTQFPLLVSFPWFLFGDKKLSADIFPNNSVHPKDDLITYILIEPVTSTPTLARKRIQFNLELRKIDTFPYLKHVTQRIIPGLWAEQSFNLDSELLGYLETRLAVLQGIHILTIVIIGLGVALCLAGCFVFAANYNGGRFGSSKVQTNPGKVIAVSMVTKNMDDVQMDPSGPPMPVARYFRYPYATSYQEHFM